ncbi:hypothetical protein [Bosea sp. R86505]|uniref:hypothetical protein n=1 Tax=Bosea sp. R86505 TaxID=3101710 RepID=UPI00366C099B
MNKSLWKAALIVEGRALSPLGYGTGTVRRLGWQQRSEHQPGLIHHRLSRNQPEAGSFQKAHKSES